MLTRCGLDRSFTGVTQPSAQDHGPVFDRQTRSGPSDQRGADRAARGIRPARCSRRVGRRVSSSALLQRPLRFVPCSDPFSEAEQPPASPSASSRSDSAGASVSAVPVVSSALPCPGIPKKGLVILSHSLPSASVRPVSGPSPVHPRAGSFAQSACAAPCHVWCCC